MGYLLEKDGKQLLDRSLAVSFSTSGMCAATSEKLPQGSKVNVNLMSGHRRRCMR